MPTLESLINRPLAIAALTLLGSVGGGMVKDRLSLQATESANAVRIQALEQFRDTQAVRRDQFDAITAEVLRRLERIDRKLEK